MHWRRQLLLSGILAAAVALAIIGPQTIPLMAFASLTVMHSRAAFGDLTVSPFTAKSTVPNGIEGQDHIIDAECVSTSEILGRRPSSVSPLVVPPAQPGEPAQPAPSKSVDFSPTAVLLGGLVLAGALWFLHHRHGRTVGPTHVRTHVWWATPPIARVEDGRGAFILSVRLEPHHDPGRQTVQETVQ